MPDNETIYQYAKDLLKALNEVVPNACRSGIAGIKDEGFTLIFNDVEVFLPINDSVVDYKPVITSDWQSFERTQPATDAQTLISNLTAYA